MRPATGWIPNLRGAKADLSKYLQPFQTQTGNSIDVIGVIKKTVSLAEEESIWLSFWTNRIERLFAIMVCLLWAPTELRRWFQDLEHFCVKPCFCVQLTRSCNQVEKLTPATHLWSFCLYLLFKRYGHVSDHQVEIRFDVFGNLWRMQRAGDNWTTGLCHVFTCTVKSNTALEWLFWCKQDKGDNHTKVVRRRRTNLETEQRKKTKSKQRSSPFFQSPPSWFLSGHPLSSNHAQMP